MLPASRPFKLNRFVGWTANLVKSHSRWDTEYYTEMTWQIGLAYVVVTTVLFLFPPDLPVTGSNMSKLIHTPFQAPKISRPLLILSCCKLHWPWTDYCVVVFFIILVISIVQWFVDGKKNFTGPRINIEYLQNGEVLGMEPRDEGSTSNSGEDEKEK